MSDVLLIVGVRTDAPGIANRIQGALELARPVGDTAGQPFAWARPIDELTAADLDRLAGLVGWDVIERMNIGGVTGDAT